MVNLYCAINIDAHRYTWKDRMSDSSMRSVLPTRAKLSMYKLCFLVRERTFSSRKDWTFIRLFDHSREKK